MGAAVAAVRDRDPDQEGVDDQEVVEGEEEG